MPYQAGELKAVGYAASREVNHTELRTALKPVQIKLSPDRATIKSGGQDLSYVTVELLDANGNRDPKTEQLVKFEITGAGQIVGVGNANPTSTESYLEPQRKTWQGRCLVVIRSGKDAGNIVLKASSEGLSPASVTIESSQSR